MSFLSPFLAAVLELLPGEPQAAPNPRCPVLSTEEASDAFVTEFRGRRVRFCCEVCVREFLDNPDRYLHNLPAGSPSEALWRRAAFFPLALLAGAAGLIAFGAARRRPGAVVGGAALGAWAAAAAGLTGLVGSLVDVEGPEGVHWGSVLGARVYVLSSIAGWVVLLGYRLRRSLGRRPAWAIAAGAVVLGAGLAALLRGMRPTPTEDLLDAIHFATFRDHGAPPAPPDAGRPPAVGGRFYRGNDERDPQLFNGGNYRTCTFDLGLEQEPGKPLVVRLDIRRAANAKKELFSPEILKKCFLTRRSDPFMGSEGPVEDRVGLRPLGEEWAWRGLYSLGPAPAEGRLQGVIYLCEEFSVPAPQLYPWSGRLLAGEGQPRRAVAGARFHYGIGYDLRFERGAPGAGSRLWLGSLYRTRTFTLNRLPYAEWFSVDPIPEIPGR